jgi:hypothetical protein
MFPLFGFVLSSFRPGESIKRTLGGMLFILEQFGLNLVFKTIKKFLELKIWTGLFIIL